MDKSTHTEPRFLTGDCPPLVAVHDIPFWYPLAIMIPFTCAFTDLISCDDIENHMAMVVMEAIVLAYNPLHFNLLSAKVPKTISEVNYEYQDCIEQVLLKVSFHLLCFFYFLIYAGRPNYICLAGSFCGSYCCYRLQSRLKEFYSKEHAKLLEILNSLKGAEQIVCDAEGGVIWRRV